MEGEEVSIESYENYCHKGTKAQSHTIVVSILFNTTLENTQQYMRCCLHSVA